MHNEKEQSISTIVYAKAFLKKNEINYKKKKRKIILQSKRSDLLCKKIF